MESLYTKDKRVATDRAPAIIAKFQAVIAEVRDKLKPQTWVPLMEQLRGSVTPIIIQPPPEIISMIQRARLEQQDVRPPSPTTRCHSKR